MTVSALLARVSSAELSEWQEYARLSGGLRDQRTDLHAAQLMTLLANVHRRKGAPPFRVEDFLPRDPDRARSTPARQSMSEFGALLNRRATE